MKSLLLIILGIFLLSPRSYGGIELLVGANLGNLEFATDTPSDNSFRGRSYGFQGTARGTLTKGRFQIGVGISSAQGKSTIEPSSGGSSEHEYKHLYYGPVIGYLFSKNLRLDIEYYTDSTIEFTKVEDQSSNVFSKGDKVFGSGFGVGVSKLSGHIITQLLYQTHTPDKVEISEIEYTAQSDEINSFSIQTLSVQIGVLF